jgi:hypothetical protein
MNEHKLWDVRAFIYAFLVEATRPPRVEEVAAHFELPLEEVISVYAGLHQRHALYLKPGTHEILMANPFSGVETPFGVRANDRNYFANCAWDALGIPAALHADAEIQAACAQTGEPIRLKVTDRQIGHSDVLVHFLVPLRAWYDDLNFT